MGVIFLFYLIRDAITKRIFIGSLAQAIMPIATSNNPMEQLAAHFKREEDLRKRKQEFENNIKNQPEKLIKKLLDNFNLTAAIDVAKRGSNRELSPKELEKLLFRCWDVGSLNHIRLAVEILTILKRNPTREELLKWYSRQENISAVFSAIAMLRTPDKYKKSTLIFSNEYGGDMSFYTRIMRSSWMRNIKSFSTEELVNGFKQSLEENYLVGKQGYERFHNKVTKQLGRRMTGEEFYWLWQLSILKIIRGGGLDHLSFLFSQHETEFKLKIYLEYMGVWLPIEDFLIMAKDEISLIETQKKIESIFDEMESIPQRKKDEYVEAFRQAGKEFISKNIDKNTYAGKKAKELSEFFESNFN